MGVCSRLGNFDDSLIRAIDNFNLSSDENQNPHSTSQTAATSEWGALEYFVVIAAWGRRLSFWRRRERS